MKTYSYTASTEADLQGIAQALVQCLGNRQYLCFYGPMGAGKTTFIKAICKALEVEDLVNSPTFSIVNQYDTVASDIIYHFDFYRLESPQEALDIGFEDYINSDAICLMEWPEKIAPLLPHDCVEVHIEVQPNGHRQIRWQL